MLELVKTEDLPDTVKTSPDMKGRAKYFMVILYMGMSYYIPLTKEIKKVLGISLCTVKGKIRLEDCDEIKIDEGVRDIIASVYLQIRDTIGVELHDQLSRQITEGLKQLFDQSLGSSIINGMNQKMLPPPEELKEP